MVPESPDVNLNGASGKPPDPVTGEPKGSAPVISRSLRRRPLVLRLFYIAAIALLIVTLGGVLVRHLIERSITPEAVLAALSEAMKRDVSAARVGVSSLHGIILEDLVMREYDADSTLILAAERLRLAPRWSALFRGRFEVATIRVSDATLHLRRDPDGWNLGRLFFELRADTSASTATPQILVENLRLVHREASKERSLLFESIRYRPNDDETRFRIVESDGRPLKIEGLLQPAENRIELSFRELDAASIPELDGAASFANLSGTIEGQATWSKDSTALRAISLSGAIEGDELAFPVGGAGTIRFGRFDLRRFTLDIDAAALAWKTEIADLRLGRPNAGLARVKANLDGEANRLKRGRVEWDGPIERILALLPGDVMPEITAWAPAGGSAGHVILAGGERRGAPRVTDLSVHFRGMTVRAPKQEAGSGLPSDETLNLHQGRFGIANATISIDTVSLTWDNDPFTVTARIAQGAATAETGWVCRIASPNFDVVRLKPWMDAEIEASGRVGADLLIKPSGTSGRITLAGTSIRLAELGAARFAGGAIEFTPEGRFTLRDLAADNGATIEGEVGASVGGGARRLRLGVKLADFDLASIRETLDAATRPHGLTLLGGAADGAIDVTGTTERRALRGAVTLRNGSAEFNGHRLAAIEGAIRFDSETLTTPGLAARLGEGSIRMAGTYAPERWKMNLTLGGLNAALLDPFLGEIQAGLGMKGPIDANLVLASATDRMEEVSRAPRMAQERPTPRPSVTGNVTFRGVEIRLRDEMTLIGAVGGLELEADRIVAKSIIAGYLGGVARLNGTIPIAASAAYQLDVSLDRGRLEHFQDVLPESVSGTGPFEAMTLAIKGTKADPRLAGSARLQGVTLRTPLTSEELREARGEIRFASDSFATPGLAFRLGEIPVRVAGGIERFENPIFRGFTISTERLRIATLMEMIPEKSRPLPRGARVSGLATLENLRIDGPADRARWSGTLVIADGAAELPGLKRGLNAINGKLTFDGEKATLTSVAGKIGNSEARIEGTIGLLPPYGLDLRLAIRDAEIEDLYAAIPRPDAAGAMDFGGKGTITAHLVQAGQDLRLEGTLADGATRGFGMPFENVSGAFAYNSRTEILSMTNLAGDWAGGRAINGAFKARLGEAAPGYEASGEIKGASLPEILRMAEINPAGYAGKVEGRMSVAGRFGAVDSINGEGSLKIERARFENLKPLDGISRALRLDFFTRGTYESARGDFTIEKGVIRTREPDHFRFNGANFALEARGYTSLEGDCAFNYVCGMSAGLVGNLLTTLQIGRLFSLSGEGGVVRTAGTIRGRVDNPVVTTDLGVLNVFGR